MKGMQAAMLGGSAMILLVLALRLLLKKHLPRRLFPALWCAAAVRLLLPIEIPTRWSVWNLLRGAEAAQTRSTGTRIPFPALTQAAETATVQTAKAGAVSPILLIWAVGMALLAAYFIVGYAVMVRRFCGTRLAPQPSVDALLDRFHFARDPRICRTANRRAPLTFGVLRPTVLLPEDLETGTAQFQLVLAHELAHIRRKDCLRKTLFAVCLCLLILFLPIGCGLLDAINVHILVRLDGLVGFIQLCFGGCRSVLFCLDVNGVSFGNLLHRTFICNTKAF